MVAAAYRQSFFPAERLSEHGVQLATVRGGNVLGGGDWAADRIVPDIVRALQSGQPVNVRNPHAIRPWQHVLDVLNGYLTLAASMLMEPHARWCTAWNFGPRPTRPVPVRELVEQFLKVWGSGDWRLATSERSPHEAPMLQLCIDKALAELSWQPRWDAAETIERTARWYRAFERGEVARQLCSADLAAFLESSTPVAAQAVPV
jgi:CDP-glucose 4,6-dehydratase